LTADDEKAQNWYDTVHCPCGIVLVKVSKIV